MNSRTHVVVAVTVFWTAARIAQGQEVSAGPDDSRATISGHVIDADSGQSLAGIAVVCGKLRTTTDGSGEYTFKAVPPGRVELSVPSKYLYPPDPLASRYIVVPLRGEVRDVDLKARLLGGVMGRVLDERGEPLEGARVTIVTRAETAIGIVGGAPAEYMLVQAVRTDDRGVYSFDGLFSTKAYWLMAEIAPTVIAEGEVWAPAGRRPAFRLTYYPRAPVIEDSTPIRLRSQEQRDHLDIMMYRSPSYCLRAALTYNGKASSADFAVQDVALVAPLGLQTGLPATMQHSGPGGVIGVCGLYAGEFIVTVAQRSKRAELPTAAGSARIRIAGRDTYAGTVAMYPPVTVRTTTTWARDCPVNALTARIRVAPTPRGEPGALVLDVPGEDTFKAIPNAQYWFQVEPLRHPLYFKDVRYGEDSILDRPFLLDHADHLELVVGCDASALDIQVRDENGGAVADARIGVVLDIGKSGSPRLVALGQTDSTGLCTIDGLASGVYYVFPLSGSQVQDTRDQIAISWRDRSHKQQVELGSRSQHVVTMISKKEM